MNDDDKSFAGRLIDENRNLRRLRGEAVDKYVDTRKREERLIEIIRRIDATLRVPAAEYVPAIQAVFEIIEKEGIKVKHETEATDIE